MDGPPNPLLPVLETILVGGPWTEIRKIPLDTLVRLFPRLDVHPETRRLLEVWIEEAPNRTRAPRLARRRAPRRRAVEAR